MIVGRGRAVGIQRARPAEKDGRAIDPEGLAQLLQRVAEHAKRVADGNTHGIAQ